MDAMTTPPNPLMAMAQQSMQNPAAQATPQPSGMVNPSQHPLIGALLKGLAQMAQSYGWTAMPPQERLERTQLEQQKAEAMARLGQSQQQIGLEGQRVGIEGQRAATEAQSVKQTGQYQQGELAESSKRTKIEEKRSQIDQQRADQEYQMKLKDHDLRTQQLEEETRSHKATESYESRRIGVEQRANELAGDRIDMEKKHFEDTVALQGKQYTRQLAEDERKQLHTALDDYYKEHPWIANITGTGPGSIQQKHKDIDTYIDQKIGVGTNATPAGLSQSGQGSSTVTHIWTPNGIQPVAPTQGQRP
jgi:hypothetical protein